MILSIIVIVRAGVKSTNVVSPYNVTHDLCMFAFFLENRFSGHSTFVLSIVDLLH